MVGVWGGTFTNLQNLHTGARECVFGKREEDWRGLEWNKKEMPSLATQRNSRQEFHFGRILGRQDSFQIRRAVSSRKYVPERGKPVWILSSKIWELPSEEPCFPSAENQASSRGQQRAVESWQLGGPEKAEVLKARPRAAIPGWKLGK